MRSDSLIREVALVVLEKIAVDWFPPRETFIDAVPVADPRFAHLPAQIHFPPPKQRGKVHQTYVEILDQAADLLNLLDRRLQPLAVLIPLDPLVEHEFAVHHNS